MWQVERCPSPRDPCLNPPTPVTMSHDYGKRNFAAVGKLRTWSWEDYAGLSRWTYYKPQVFIRGRQEGQRQRDVTAEPETGVMHTEDSGKVPQSHQLWAKFLVSLPGKPSRPYEVMLSQCKQTAEWHWQPSQRWKKSWIPGQWWWRAAHIKCKAAGNRVWPKSASLSFKRKSLWGYC